MRLTLLASRAIPVVSVSDVTMRMHHRQCNMSTSHPILFSTALMRMTIISIATQIDTPNDSLIALHTIAYTCPMFVACCSVLNVSLSLSAIPESFPPKTSHCAGIRMEVRILCMSWRDACMHARMYSTTPYHNGWTLVSRGEKAPRKERRNPVPEVLCPTPTVSMFQATLLH